MLTSDLSAREPLGSKGSHAETHRCVETRGFQMVCGELWMVDKSHLCFLKEEHGQIPTRNSIKPLKQIKVVRRSLVMVYATCLCLQPPYTNMNSTRVLKPVMMMMMMMVVGIIVITVELTCRNDWIWITWADDFTWFASLKPPVQSISLFYLL